MASFISLLIAIFKAIPALQKLFESLMALYVQRQIDQMDKELLNAIARALKEKDQRDIEKAIGSPRAGEPSGTPGTVIIDHPPPGVKP